MTSTRNFEAYAVVIVVMVVITALLTSLVWFQYLHQWAEPGGVE